MGIVRSIAQLLRVSTTIDLSDLLESNDVALLTEPVGEPRKDELDIAAVGSALDSFQSFLNDGFEGVFPAVNFFLC